MPIHTKLGALARLRLIIAALAVCPILFNGAVRADTLLPPLGGPGGGAFDARCPAGQILWGVELRTADDVDAIRPVCAIALHVDQITGETVGNIWHGGEGGMQRRIACPLARPVVLGVEIGDEGETDIVNNIRLFCGLVTDARQTFDPIPAAAFDGPLATPSSSFKVSPLVFGRERCAPGQVAVGIHGRSGVWLDAVGLICDASPLSGVTVHSIGRAPSDGKSVPKFSPCQAAALARSKGQTVAASALEAKCLESFKH